MELSGYEGSRGLPGEGVQEVAGNLGLRLRRKQLQKWMRYPRRGEKYRKGKGPGSGVSSASKILGVQRKVGQTPRWEHGEGVGLGASSQRTGAFQRG